VAEGPDEIRQAIEATRNEIGDTVDALVAKTDVKGRATAKAQETISEARAKVVGLAGSLQDPGGEPGPLIGSSGAGSKRSPAVAGAVAAVLLLIVVRRRRHRRRG
jgi:hypothetical protein